MERVVWLSWTMAHRSIPFMPKYVSDQSLQVGSITNLLGAKVICIGLCNAYTRLLGNIVIWVQVGGVQGYDEDQTALVILDISKLCSQSPCHLKDPYHQPHS